MARALLANRPLLLLDEPTAHLDTETASALTAELRHLTTNRTALIVTHHPEEFPDLPTYALPGSSASPRAPSTATR